MNSTQAVCHVVAMPYPGRGHINPMINLCKSLASRAGNILLTVVVTEEWLGLIDSEDKPEKLRFCSVPNVLPSERVRGADFQGFLEAVWTQMEAPVERLLNGLHPPATLIMADTILSWAVSVGNRRNIPVASFWPMSAMMFSVFQHYHLFAENGHFQVDLSEKGAEIVDYIPGVSPTCLRHLPVSFGKSQEYAFDGIINAFSCVHKAHYLLLTSVYEFETEAIDVLRAEFPFPVCAIGPAIPYLKPEDNLSSSAGESELSYSEWLNNQPRNSVLYVSMGSFLSVSREQMDEIAAGLRSSGVRFLWVAREETARLEESCGEKGIVVPWCNQLRVLSHSSIGGFWTHCGWNSVREGLYSGVPFLTFPLVADQTLNQKLIVEDWKIGWRLKKELKPDILVSKDEIARTVQKFMDIGSDEVKEMRKRVKQLQEKWMRAMAKDGSSESNINLFFSSISKCNGK